MAETAAELAERAASLTDQERACLRLVWDERLKSKQIAERLNLSHHTIDNYLKSAAKKMRAFDRTEAARFLAVVEDRLIDQRLANQSPEIASFTPTATVPLPDQQGGGTEPRLAVKEMQATYLPDISSGFAPPSPKRGDRNALGNMNRLVLAALIALAAPLLLGALAGALELIIDAGRSLGF